MANEKKKVDEAKSEEVENQEVNEACEEEVEETELNVADLVKENEALKVELDKALKDAQSYKESWVRTAADFENFKKRNQDTRSNAYRDGKVDAIVKLLVVGDNLDRALMMELDDKTREGIELTARQFKETLSSMGVTEINPVGKPFDPNTQEAVLQAEKGEGEDSGIVKQVFLKGYKLGDKVIRYAQVVVIG